jgi:hypothetical protein
MQLGGSVLEVPDAGIKRASPSSAIKGALAGRPCFFFGGLIDWRRGRDLGVEGACFRDCELWVGCVGCGG